MIKLERERTDSAIRASFRGNSRIKQALKLIEGQRNGEHKFADAYWKKAKDQLKKESFGKCAYCEASTSTVAWGDVEHFRPKSTYWWLAYCYDNYLYSCQICNEGFKGKEFPIHGAMLALDPPFPNPFPDNLTPAQLKAIAQMFAPDPFDDANGYPMVKFLAAVTAEKGDLPNPYYVDPEPFFKWEAKPVLKEVLIQPRDNQPTTLDTHAAVEKYFGLNREELRGSRWLTYQKLERVKRILENTPADSDAMPDIKGFFQEAMSPAAPYAGMSRYFIRVEWQLNVD